MERTFMIYQRRDGFQIAEEATGTRLATGMEMLARPNKSADWCFAAFNIDLNDGEDGYELVGEESIDCSVAPAQMIEFVDGVMKITSTFAEVLDMEEAHSEALKMNVGIGMALTIITKLTKPGEEVEAGDSAGGCLYRAGFNEINYMVSVALRMYREREELHAEALEINAAIDSMIQARQQIANKEPDFLQETWDLVRLGNSYKEAGREWYRWAKATALRLWESSLAQRQILQAK